MDAAYSDSRDLIDDIGALPTLTQTTESAIERLSADRPLASAFARLDFPPDLEALYQAECRSKRLRQIRFTLSVAAVFQLLPTFTDHIFVPDLGSAGFWMRALSAFVLFCGVAALPRLSAAMRELALCGFALLGVAVLATLPMVSHSPLAPFGLFWTVLAIVYGNTGFPLPFHFAWPFNLAAVGGVLLAAYFNPRIGGELLVGLALLTIVPVCFTLLANYRMERNSRLAYLFAAREALRLRAIARDRDQFQTVSNTDAMTGLANRGRFDRRAAELLNPAASPGMRVCLLLLDVDFFKPYNDRYGHVAGDACLKSVAAVLSNVMRGQRDFAFRYGGEEFGALILDVSEDQLLSIAHRIRAAVEDAAIPHEGRPDSTRCITVSIGAAVVASGGGASVRRLIDRADRALYEAKRTGRNRIVSAASLPDANPRRKFPRTPAPAHPPVDAAVANPLVTTNA